MIERVGIWAIPVSDDSRDRFIQRVRYLGLTDVYLFINDVSQREFVLSPGRERNLILTAAALRDEGVVPHITTWLRPRVRYVEDCARRLYPICERADLAIESLQFDAEATWWRRSEGGGVARALSVTRDHWPFGDWPCELGVTSYGSFHALAPAALEALRPLIAKCDYVVPQAYSTRRESTRYRRPGVTQRMSHESWRNIVLMLSAGIPVPVLVGAVKDMRMGLAAYNLTRVDEHGRPVTQDQAMQLAIEAVEALRRPSVTHVIYWSFNNLIASVTRTEFVRNLGATLTAAAT